MIKIIVIFWILFGVGVVLYGIHKKKKYGYISPATTSALIIIVASIIIWPLTIVMILNFLKREEQIINEVIKDNPKYTRDMLIKGGEIWRNMRKGK